METLPEMRSVSERLLIAGGLLVAGSILYTLCLFIYRLFFHPLAKFPGPWLNAVSDVSRPLQHQENELLLTCIRCPE